MGGWDFKTCLKVILSQSEAARAWDSRFVADRSQAEVSGWPKATTLVATTRNVCKMSNFYVINIIIIIVTDWNYEII